MMAATLLRSLYKHTHRPEYGRPAEKCIDGMQQVNHLHESYTQLKKI
jgi:hypothetical protein